MKKLILVLLLLFAVKSYSQNHVVFPGDTLKPADTLHAAITTKIYDLSYIENASHYLYGSTTLQISADTTASGIDSVKCYTSFTAGDSTGAFTMLYNYQSNTYDSVITFETGHKNSYYLDNPMRYLILKWTNSDLTEYSTRRISFQLECKK